jgi:hypothetical protein
VCLIVGRMRLYIFWYFLYVLFMLLALECSHNFEWICLDGWAVRLVEGRQDS